MDYSHLWMLLHNQKSPLYLAQTATSSEVLLERLRVSQPSTLYSKYLEQHFKKIHFVEDLGV